MAPATGDAWAVGSYDNGRTQETLIEQWTGSAWEQEASPSPEASPKGGAALYAVAATSGTNAWAVGNYYNPKSQETLTLIVHWNGRTWRQVASPSPGFGTSALDTLFGVSATSPTNAWAAGQYFNGHAYQTLILHWNGTAWSQVASPDPGGPSLGNSLTSVAATSASSAWAVGIQVNRAGGSVTLVLHWNGSVWSHVASQNVGPSFPGDTLSAVTATPSATPWAAGSYCATKSCPARNTLLEGWNGTAWAHAVSP